MQSSEIGQNHLYGNPTNQELASIRSQTSRFTGQKVVPFAHGDLVRGFWTRDLCMVP
jgi:hypothetical protein